LAFVLVSLNSYNNITYAQLSGGQSFFGDESPQTIEIANHQTGIDAAHTAYIKIQKGLFKYRIRGRHQEVRYNFDSLPQAAISFFFTKKIYCINTEGYIYSYLSNGFQFRGPPIASC
jgi:hypothetical protein